MGFIRDWRRRRLLERTVVPEAVWREARAQVPGSRRLAAGEVDRLRRLAVLFVHEKHIDGVQGLQLTEAMRYTIALHACLPILGLGIDWYSGWVSVVVYPAGFVPRHQYTDEAGVLHTDRRPLSGEAWLRGPVILSWPDVEASAALDGYNVVIHEFAHKLDMRNGAANGRPPLHRGMDPAAWARAFQDGYSGLKQDLAAGAETALDPYAAESPAEFFAVVSEAFFETPAVLKSAYPAVYRQLAAFYRQDPL